MRTSTASFSSCRLSILTKIGANEASMVDLHFINKTSMLSSIIFSYCLPLVRNVTFYYIREGAK